MFKLFMFSSFQLPPRLTFLVFTLVFLNYLLQFSHWLVIVTFVLCFSTPVWPLPGNASIRPCACFRNCFPVCTAHPHVHLLSSFTSRGHCSCCPLCSEHLLSLTAVICELLILIRMCALQTLLHTQSRLARVPASTWSGAVCLHFPAAIQ